MYRGVLRLESRFLWMTGLPLQLFAIRHFAIRPNSPLHLHIAPRCILDDAKDGAGFAGRDFLA